MINQQNDLCTQWRFRSAWTSSQSDQSLRCLHEEIWTDAQADLRLRWAHKSFCRFFVSNFIMFESLLATKCRQISFKWDTCVCQYVIHQKRSKACHRNVHVQCLLLSNLTCGCWIFSSRWGFLTCMTIKLAILMDLQWNVHYSVCCMGICCMGIPLLAQQIVFSRLKYFTDVDM